MRASGLRLVTATATATPRGPVQDVRCNGWWLPDKREEEPAHLGNRERQEILPPLPPLGNVSNITVRYFGDENYGPADSNFPLTNPPIPGTGSGSSGGSGSHSGQATATPKGSASPTVTATAGATTPTTVGSSTGAGAPSPPALPSRPGSNSGPLLFLVVILLILFGQGVAGGILIYMTRRARLPAMAGGSQPLSDAPAQSPVLPELSNADTSPVP